MQYRRNYHRRNQPYQDVPVDHFPITFGRDTEVDVRVADPSVSRFHCQIDINEMGDGLIVRDLGSRNGTYLNGVPVIEAPLVRGDILTIGMNNFTVALESDPLPAGAAEIRQTLRQLHQLWLASLAELN